MNTWPGLILSALGTIALPAIAELAAVDPGPYNIATGKYPAWYQDENNLSLELCQSKAISSRAPGGPAAPGYMCTLIPEPGVYDDTLPMVFPGNWPGELFWFTAETDIPNNAAGYGLEVYVAAVEAAFSGGEVPVDGEQQSFARIRIRASIPVAGTYTVTHPYGVETIRVTQTGRRAINMTRDLGIGAPGDFTGALTGDIGPFLQSVNGPYTELNPETGEMESFIGDPNLLEQVTGSPNGTNFVRIEGPAGVIETNLFTLSGKVFDSRPPTDLQPGRTTYRRTAGQTRLEVFADSVNDATVCLRKSLALVGNPPGPCEQNLLSDNNGHFFAHDGSLQAPPELVVITASAPSGTKPSSGSSRIVDVVKIATARYSWADQRLVVEARSSDEVQIPDLVVQGYGRMSKSGTLQTLTVNGLAQPPASVVVKSSAGGSDTEDVVVVGSAPPQAENQPPTGQPDSASTSAGVPVTINVLANDSDPNGNTPLTITDLQQPAAGLGTVALSGNTALIYTPPSVVNEQLTVTFSYRVQDSLGAISEPVSVTVTVVPNTGENPPPVGQPDSASTSAGVPVTIDVLANDSDPNGNTPLTITDLQQPAAGQGTVALSGTTALIYTPPSVVNEQLTVTFSYRVQDSLGAVSEPVSVTVTVAPTQAANQPPVGQPDSASTRFDAPVTIDVLANDSDPDGNTPLSVTGLQQPASGQGSVAPSGTTAVIYTPPAVVNSPLTATFSYQVQDSLGAVSEPVSVTVTVTPNQAPTANPDSGSTAGVPLTIDVLANDSDPEGHPLSVVNLGQPASGLGTVSTDGSTVVYTPPPGITAPLVATFTYQARDSLGATSAPATVTVNAGPPENLVVNTAEFIARAGNRHTWSFDGTTTITSGNSISVEVTTADGVVSLGSATVPATGRWRVSVTTTGLVLDANPTATIRSSAGTLQTVPVVPR